MAGLKHTNGEVRQLGINVICEVYKTHGTTIKPLLKDLRIAQLELLDKAFQTIDSTTVQHTLESTQQQQTVPSRKNMTKFGSFKG